MMFSVFVVSCPGEESSSGEVCLRLRSRLVLLSRDLRPRALVLGLRTVASMYFPGPHLGRVGDAEVDHRLTEPGLEVARILPMREFIIDSISCTPLAADHPAPVADVAEVHLHRPW
jgi:hypothetical protein